MLKSVIDRIGTFALKRFFAGVARLPEERGIDRCERLVRLIVRIVPRLHPTALRNLEIVFPEMSLGERELLACRSYRVLAANLYWFSRLGELSADEVKRLFDYSEAQPIFNRIVQQRTGALLITVHFGLFELLAQGQTLLGRPYAILNRDFGFPHLDAFWRERRERFGSQMFGRKGGFKEIVRHLEQGRDVAVLFDQNVKRKHAIFVDLFGVPAATTKAIGYAALRVNCPVVFAACLENPPERRHLGRFRIHAREIQNPNSESGSTEEQVRKFLRKLHVELEGIVRTWPEGWFWIHRRWKTRPDGEREDLY